MGKEQRGRFKSNHINNSLSVNSLNTPIKMQKLSDGIKKPDSHR